MRIERRVRGRVRDCSVAPWKFFFFMKPVRIFYVSAEIKQRIAIGALKVWGNAGRDDPPYLVLSLTVQVSKPRLCLDARFF